MNTRMIKTSSIQQNAGQIEGLPKNPREWTSDDVDVLCRSIEETPELLEARGIIVYPYEGRFVAIGGPAASQ